MTAYIIRRLLLMVPTLVGIMLLNFVIVQFAPGGPIDRVVAQLQGQSIDATARFTNMGDFDLRSGEAGSRGARGLDPDFIAELERMYGFDRPAHERFLKMMADYLTFDFGESFYQNRSVVDLIID